MLPAAGSSIGGVKKASAVANVASADAAAVGGVYAKAEIRQNRYVGKRNKEATKCNISST